MAESISMSFNFGEECKRHQVNQAFAEQVGEKLFTLLESAIEIHSFNFFLVQKYANSQNIFKNFKIFTAFTDKIRRDLTVTREEFAFLFLLNYLVVVESLYAFVVDIIVFALINVGKQLENPRTGRFVVLFNELKELALGTKLDFLKAHKFKIIANRCDITLRNAAAHLDFTLDDKGNIHYKGHVVKGSHDMSKIWEEIREAAICSHIALMHFYYEKYGKYMPWATLT